MIELDSAKGHKDSTRMAHSCMAPCLHTILFHESMRLLYVHCLRMNGVVFFLNWDFSGKSPVNLALEQSGTTGEFVSCSDMILSQQKC